MLKTLLLSVMVLVSCQGNQASQAPMDPSVQVSEAQRLIQEQADLVILDVRTPGEYASGHLRQARPLDFQDAKFQQELVGLDHKQTYLLYCASGNRSGQAMQIMKQQGFEQVYDLQGGIAAWQSSGGAIVR